MLKVKRVGARWNNYPEIIQYMNLFNKLFEYCIFVSKTNEVMNSIIRNKSQQIVALCEKYNVNKLYVFGSVVKGKFSTATSDIDLFVELLPMPVIDRGQALIDFWDQLELLFGCKVDLITDQPIRNKYFLSELEKTKQLIYDRKKQEILI